MTARTPNDRGARWWIGAAYIALLALAIPWYWPVGDARHVHGVPLWAIAALSAVLAASIFTAWVYLARSEDEPDESSRGPLHGRAGPRDRL